MATTAAMTFDEFRRMVAEELRVEPDGITPETSFTNDLLVDSIRMLEMVLRLETLVNEMPIEALWNMRTVGDAYRFYSEQAKAA
ncbi:MAG: acyl carrier protein [Anaerolineales bacterium]